MPTTYKILGALTGTSTSTAIYTVPAGKQAVISTLTLANNSGSNQFVDVRVQINGAGTNFYIVPQAILAPATHQAFTEGWTLNAGDVLKIYGVGVDFIAFGSEIS